MIHRLSFKNPNRGKQPRAAFWVRWPRIWRRHRVAIAQTGLAQAIRRAEREAGRLAHIAHVYKVPVTSMDALPAVPDLPSDRWVEHLVGMGELAPVVIVAPPEPAEAIHATA
jgi:hypothetical protein